MRVFFLIYLLLIAGTAFSQTTDVTGYIIYKGDTIDLKGTIRVKPIEPPPPPPLPTICTAKGVRRYVTPQSWGGLYVNGRDFKVNPGDTLVIRSKDKWAGLDMENFHGSSTCPIVIINEGDVNIPAGFKMKHCTYIKLTGSGTSTKYGFRIEGNGSGPAFEITGRSAHVEVERLFGWKKYYAGWIKHEADCADSLQYPNWYMDDISIHDCKFVNIGQDGLYLGSTSPTGQREAYCDGKLTYPLPIRLSNIRVYNNIIDSCNRTGIQLSGADKGDNRIYNNTVTRCGYELNQTQGDGIALGGMTTAWVYGNTIDSTFKHGIFAIGAGLAKIESNIIKNNGWVGKSFNNWQPVNIFVDNRQTVPANVLAQFIIRNNVFGKNAQLEGKNIVVYNSNKLFASGNIISGNTTLSGGAANLQIASDVNWSDGKSN